MYVTVEATCMEFRILQRYSMMTAVSAKKNGTLRFGFSGTLVINQITTAALSLRFAFHTFSNE